MTQTTPRLIRLPAVMAMTALSRSSIYLRIQRGEFPPPRRLTSHASAWLVSDVTAWIAARPIAEPTARGAA